ncbi:hypothetical protein D3C73_987790 [compost metagenome]
MASSHARELAKNEPLCRARAGSAGNVERWPHQNTNAISANTAQIANPMRQLSKRIITNGAKDAAMAAPPMIDVTYKPMQTATLSLNRDLISAGINAWINAMPTPATTALRMSSSAESRNRRDAVARPMISSDTATVRCSPKRWLMRRPRNIANPMAMTGSMVSSEARLKLRAMSPPIALSNGPTAAMEGRKFSATSMRVSIRRRAGREVARMFSMVEP